LFQREINSSFWGLFPISWHYPWFIKSCIWWASLVRVTLPSFFKLAYVLIKVSIFN
jgi:hypothetical protein